MNNILYLASSSASRKQLLTDSQIPFEVVSQTADELPCDSGLSLQELVERIATDKMNHVVMPDGINNEYAFVLTADTLTEHANGAIVGKPVDHADAIAQLRSIRDTWVITGTAFCLEKRQFQKDSNSWVTVDRIVQYVASRYQFCVSEEWIDRYLAASGGLSGSSAIAIEGYGSLFLKEMQGSYSSIVGLPLFEVRCALEKIGFFS
jgi:septum formation protein